MCSQWGGQGSLPSQGNRLHMLQLRPGAKSSQINREFLKNSWAGLPDKYRAYGKLAEWSTTNDMRKDDKSMVNESWTENWNTVFPVCNETTLKSGANPSLCPLDN